jgi:hypothetical protein
LRISGELKLQISQTTVGHRRSASAVAGAEAIDRVTVPEWAGDVIAELEWARPAVHAQAGTWKVGEVTRVTGAAKREAEAVHW